MPHSREARTHAHEIKFVVEAHDAERIRAWARALLQPDPHGTGAFGDEYRTTSLYFDTGALDVFHRRGSFGRSKYRIRRYGEDELVFLERKLRRPSVLAKRRTPTALAALDRLAHTYGDEEWAGHWFRRRVAARQLRPVCQVTYRRMARSLDADGHHARLTLDVDVTAVRVHSVMFRDAGGIAVTGGRAILELKYRHSPPALFKQLIEELALVPQSASKYRLGIASLTAAAAADVSTACHA
jgi:VTC domain